MTRNPKSEIRRRAAPAALVLGAVLIGFVPWGVRESGVGPLSAGFWRFALALPLILLLAGRSANTVPWRPGLLALCGLFFAADIAGFFVAITTTTSANATLLSNLAPLGVVAWMALVLGRPPGAAGWLGMCLAIVGMVGLAWPHVALGGERLRGDLLALLSAIFYAGYQLTMSALRRDQPALRVMAAVGLCGTLGLGALALLFGEPLLPPDGRSWLILCGLSFATQLAGQGLITWALAHLPTTGASVVLLLQPLVATIIGWLALNEALTPLQWLGGVLVLAGVAVVMLSRAGAR